MDMALHEFNYEKEKTVNIVKKILEDAILIFATDIHFDPKEDELTIRLRIDGDLILYTTVPESAMKNIITRIKILAGMNITESSIPQTGFITYKMKDVTHNMRVSSIPVVHGEKIVVHISNHANKFAKLEELNFSEYDLKKIKNLLNNTAGTILIAGSTTSGKATTLYAMVHELDHNKKNIFTIENRIKANIDGVNQIQIDKHKGLTPIKILKNVLLSDPNVIVLSEINDIETANSILNASITGRLVISTIHSKNIYTTIDTLINMDIENYLLSSSLTGVISQRLVKRLCPKCRKKRKTTDLEKEIFTMTINKNIKEIYEPVGCDNCIGGYQGQLPISEVVEINDAIRNAITNPREKTNLRKLVYENNSTIFEDGLNKVINGDTSLDEVIRVIDLNSDFAKDEEILKKLILDEINANDIDDNTENVNVSIRSLIPDKIAIDDIVIEEKKDNKEEKENKKVNKEDIDSDITSEDVNSNVDDIDEDEVHEDKEDVTVEENNNDNDIAIDSDEEENNDNDITTDSDDENNGNEEEDIRNTDNVPIEEDNDDNNLDNEKDYQNIEKTTDENDNLRNKKKDNKAHNKKEQNINENEEDETSVDNVTNEEETKLENEETTSEEDKNEPVVNEERINNILDNYIIDENGILVAKSIIEKKQKENNDEEEKDNTQQEIANNNLVNEQQDNNEELNETKEETILTKDDLIKQEEIKKTVQDKKKAIDNASLSITDEDIQRIKSTINYDDFSYDDSYKNDF